MYQTVLIQTLWFRNIPIYMSLCSFSFNAQVCRLLWLTPQDTEKVPKILTYIFKESFTFSSMNKKAYPLHLIAKKVLRETAYVILSFLGQKTGHVFWIALKISIHFSSFMSWRTFGYASYKSDPWTECQPLHLGSLKRRGIWYSSCILICQNSILPKSLLFNILAFAFVLDEISCLLL